MQLKILLNYVGCRNLDYKNRHICFILIIEILPVPWVTVREQAAQHEVVILDSLSRQGRTLAPPSANATTHSPCWQCDSNKGLTASKSLSE
jgi:hypothetical protein